MERGEFEKLVGEALDLIPQRFQDLISNVAVIVEDEPTPAQKQQLGLRHGVSLFGLYEGVSLPHRGGNYTNVLPDRITIFQKPIEYVAGDDPERIREMVRETVMHEVAHYFGFSEEDIRLSKRKKKKE